MTTTDPSGTGTALRAEGEREFKLDDHHFQVFQQLARQIAGIELNETKRELVYGRLARRLRALGFTDFDAYVDLLKQDESPEQVEFINAITTNVTSFFREEHHFEYLRDEVLPQMMVSRATTRKLRVWSAACSIGPEPYSIGITMASAIPTDQTWDWRILATDIDRTALAKAEAGIYGQDDIPDLKAYGGRSKWFQPGPNGRSELQVVDSVRRMIYFRPLNLMEGWPMTGPIDVIFCRNVVIYFSKETQRKLFKRFHEILAPDGYVFIGHSESMLHSADLFESVGRTIYRRK